jgi:hypothetical protein
MYIKDGKSPLEGQWNFYQTPSFVLETSPACFYLPQKLSSSNLVASILREVLVSLFPFLHLASGRALHLLACFIHLYFGLFWGRLARPNLGARPIVESLTGDHAFLESIGHAIDVAEGKAMSVPSFIE